MFDDSVKDSIHDFTGGVPRQINNLATACLLQATARKLPRIDDDVFQQAAQANSNCPKPPRRTMPCVTSPTICLRRLRNQIPFGTAVRAACSGRTSDAATNWPSSAHVARETHSAVNPRTNLARCFHCQTNFNPIDFTMDARECDFVEAVQYLAHFLPGAENHVPSE